MASKRGKVEMVEKTKQPSKNGKKIVYVGDDQGYWQTIVQRFKQAYPDKELIFKNFPAANKDNCQSIMRDVILFGPNMAYVDLSFNHEWQLKVAHFLRRENTTRKIPLVGLVENKASLKESLLTGMTFTHVKCGEFHDVVFDPFFLAYPKEAKAKQFARAKMSEQSVIIDDFLVSYFAPTYMHVEGNIKLEKGQKIRLHHNIPAKVFMSEYFVVRSVSTADMYYDYKYSYDLEYIYVDEPKLEPDRANDISAVREFEQAKANYKQELERAKKKTREWVELNSNVHELKLTKILVVDSKMDILVSKGPKITQSAFTIRCQSLLTEELDELTRILPHMIAYQFEEGSPEIENAHFGKIKAIVDKAKSLKDYNPFIVVFNAPKYPSKFLQEKLGHDKVVSYGKSISSEFLLELANIYETREKKNHEEAAKKRMAAMLSSGQGKNAKNERDIRFFVDKKSESCHLYADYDIEVIGMTESEITFSTEAELQITAYRFAFPGPMALTVVPIDGKLATQDKNKYIYKALLHSIGEDDKKALRQHINTIFCAPNEEQRKKDADEFEKKNQEVLKKRQEESSKSESEDEEEEEG